MKQLVGDQLKREKDIAILGSSLLDKGLTQAAFTEIYDSYFPRLFNYVSYRVSSQPEVEDFVALIFERILTKYHTFDPSKGSLDNWVFSIARNALSNHWRGLRRHPQTSLDQTNEQVEIFEADDTYVPSEYYLRNEELERLRTYLKRLNHRERDLVALRYGAGLNQRRIGEILGMKESNVAVALGRVVKKLRQWFDQDEQ